MPDKEGEGGGAAKRALTFAIATTVLVGFIPLGNLFLNPLERTFPPNPEIIAPQGIIVLGGAEHVAPDYVGGFAQVNDAAERLIVAVNLADRFPDATVLYSGGKDFDSQGYDRVSKSIRINSLLAYNSFSCL